MAEFVTLLAYPYEKKKLAEAVLGRLSPLRAKTVSGPVQLTLGIRRNGKPDILIPKDDARRLVNVPLPTNQEYRYARDFESLSPVLFHNVEELAKRLTTLSKKSTGKRLANQDDGIVRGAFEHGRTLFYILQGRLDPSFYGLPGATWDKSMKIVSLVFNTWGGDTRSSGERLLHPMLLDIGWSEATIPNVTTKTSSVKHYLIHEHRYMNRGSQPMDFEHGKTEQLPSAEISQKLKEVFQMGSAREPVILLVHDEGLGRNALRDFGLDTSTWESGLKGLLGYSSLKREPRGSYSSRPQFKREDYEYRYRGRSRSPSPRRSVKPDPDRPYSSRSYYSRRSSPPRSRDNRVYAPVYIVDLKQLYTKMMLMEDGGRSVVEMAQRFNLRDEDNDKWCAGNEAVLLTQIWHSMISGPPIDEHRTALDAGWVQAPAPAAQLPAEDVDDEDRDPNDFVYGISAEPESVDRPKAGMYETDSDDAYDSD